MRECERLVDGLFYMIDQRRMLPTQDLHLRADGCLGRRRQVNMSDTDGDEMMPTTPLTFSLMGVAYALCYMAGAVALRAYIFRQVQAAINRAVAPLLEVRNIDMADD